MNVLRSIIKPFDRRVADQGVSLERRGSPATRLNAASERVDIAIDELCKIVTMSRGEFNAMVERDRVRDAITFADFSERCEFRYFREKDLQDYCRNPEHEKICTTREFCEIGLCPKLKKYE